MESFIFIRILGIISFIIGVILVSLSKKNKIKKNIMLEKIISILPGINCIECGYLNCVKYAEAILKGEEITLCSSGGAIIKEKLVEITGKILKNTDRKVARIFCQGDNTKVKKKYEFDSNIKSCLNVNLYFNGDKNCTYSCLGYGDCKEVCPVNAIYTTAKGIFVIDEDKCISCEKCIKTCPKNIIKMIPYNSKVAVLCSNKENSKLARNNCFIACIACGLCVKSCPVNAIEINKNLAKIDYDKCINCRICALKCPTNAIKSELKEYRIAEIIHEKCVGCGSCREVCPALAIEGENQQKHKVIDYKCIGCGLCYETCEYSAIFIRNKIIKE